VNIREIKNESTGIRKKNMHEMHDRPQKTAGVCHLFQPEA